MIKRDFVFKLIIYLFLIALATITLFPIIYAVLGSTKSSMEILVSPGNFWPEKMTFEGYQKLFLMKEFNVFRMLINSIYYTIGKVFIILASSTLIGYVYARGEFPGKKTIFYLFTAMMFVKSGGLGIYATFNVLNAINMNRGLNTILFLTAFSIPIVYVYLIKGFILSLPKELDESARIDGCTFLGTFFRILLPLLKPILATIAVLTFKDAWNDYVSPTIYTATKPEQQTLIVGLMSLKDSGGAATDWSVLLAGTMIAFVPTFVTYIVGNRFFVSGISAGAVKG